MGAEKLIQYYILAGRTPVPVTDTLTWATWFETANRRVAVSRSKLTPAYVSTVFLGLDHSWNLEGGTPILFETMILGGRHDGYQERCSTWEEAEAMHKTAEAIVHEVEQRVIDNIKPTAKRAQVKAARRAANQNKPKRR